MSEIVVGYDGSECGKAALAKACELASALGDRLVIVFGYAPRGYGGGEVPSHREAVEEFGERVAAEARERAGAAGVEHEVRLLARKAYHALLETAEELDARMIVVGSYGDPPLKGMILGSTPNKLLYMSARPVLVVPAPEGR